jgi:FKBP-type peptidyl-prolyl cis-trans isomerase 2
MNKEKTTPIALVIAIVVVISALIVLTNEDIFENLFGGDNDDQPNGNVSYMEFDRTVIIERNQTQNITYQWPPEMVDYLVDLLKQVDPTIDYSFHKLAGESLTFEVDIENIYNTTTNVTKNVIELGDCVDLNYIGRYSSNDTVFDTSYEDYVNKTNGTLLKVFISMENEAAPAGYEEYSSTLIEGFMEGLIGLELNESTKIGPIPPEKAYGVEPQIGDTINVSGEMFGQDLNLEFIDIVQNAEVPEEFKDIITTNKTTLYIMKDNSYHVGQTFTLYPSWVNSSVVTKINDTMIWLKTTPPADKMYNFTWIELDTMTGYENAYWTNASSVTTLNDEEIVVTHNPEIGQTMTRISGWTSIEYTVVEITDDKIKVSYSTESDF